MALIEKLNAIGDAIRAKTGKTAKLTLAEMPNEIASIESGNGGSIEVKQKITVIDYDGTILEESYVAEGETYTLPTAPTQSGLTFQKWACPIEITDNQITVENYPVTIAPIYGSTTLKFEVALNKATGLTVNIKNIALGYLTWGDGSTASGGNSFTHTYSSYGTYTITISGATTIGEYVFGQSSSAHNFYLKKIFLSSSITSIGNYAFRYCENLETVTIPNAVTSIGLYAFEYCYNLKTAIIPASVQNLYSYAFQYTWGGLKYVVIDYGVTTISNYVFQYSMSLKHIIFPNTSTLGNYICQSCYSLETFKFPDNYSTSSSTTPFGSLYSLKNIILKNSTMTTFGGSFLSYAYALENFEIPSSVTSIGYSSFNNCYSLKRIKIPSGVTTINSSLFTNCKSLEIIDFSTHTSVPTLSSTSSFSTISKQAKIVVPDSLYSTWTTATNWLTFENQIYKASEVSL